MSLPLREVGSLGQFKNGGEQQLLSTMVWSNQGESKPLMVLADTGAQVNLVGRDLFDSGSWQTARNPVDLRSVSGQKVDVGDMTV